MKIYHFLACIGATAIVAGCSSQRHDKPQPTEIFHTEITRDGSKMFEYRLVMAAREGGRGERSGRPPRPGMDQGGKPPSERKQRGASEDRDKMLDGKLAAYLEQNGYCRQGYTVLERQHSQASNSVRGECKEAATDEDWEAFGQAKPQPFPLYNS